MPWTILVLDDVVQWCHTLSAGMVGGVVVLIVLAAVRRFRRGEDG